MGNKLIPDNGDEIAFEVGQGILKLHRKLKISSMKHFINEENVVWRNINGEIIALNLSSGSHYTFNKIGSLIWLLLEKKVPTEEIILQASHEFSVPRDQIKEDVLSFFRNLKQEGLIKP